METAIRKTVRTIVTAMFITVLITNIFSISASAEDGGAEAGQSRVTAGAGRRTGEYKGIFTAQAIKATNKSAAKKSLISPGKHSKTYMAIYKYAAKKNMAVNKNLKFGRAGFFPPVETRGVKR